MQKAMTEKGEGGGPSVGSSAGCWGALKGRRAGSALTRITWALDSAMVFTQWPCPASDRTCAPATL